MKKQSILFLSLLLLAACSAPDNSASHDDHEEDIPEGVEALLYSQNRLLNANYDFDLDFYEDVKDTASVKELSTFNHNARNEYPAGIYDLTNIPVPSYDAFKQLRDYLESSSKGAKETVNNFTEKITVLNTPVKFVSEENNDEHVEVIPPEGPEEPTIIDIPDDMSMINYDEETDTVSLINHYKNSSISQITLSYDDKGKEVVNSFSASASGNIHNTIYIPDSYCFYFYMRLGYKNESSTEYDGYLIDMYEFTKINNYNWSGMQVDLFIDKDKVEDLSLLTQDDLLGTWVTLYETDFGHAYGVSLRVEKDEQENLYLSPVKTSSGFMDYGYNERSLYFRISEMLGFDKAKLNIRETDERHIYDAGEEYVINMNDSINSDDYYITTKNGKKIFSNSYIRVNPSNDTYIYEEYDPYDEDFLLDPSKMFFSSTISILKGVYEDLGINSPNEFVVSPYSYCYLYFFTDDSYQNATNIDNFFTYFGLKAINGHPLYTGLGSFLHIMNNPSVFSSRIYKDITGESLSVLKLLMHYRVNLTRALETRNQTLHYFDNKDFILSKDLPKKVSAELVNLNTSINVTVSEDGLSFETLNVDVNKSHLLFDDRSYALVLFTNNQMNKEITSNVVTYNGNKMSFTANWHLDLPNIDGLYSYSYALVKIDNGKYIPISNIVDINISNFNGYDQYLGDDEDGGYYERHYVKQDNNLNVYTLHIEAESEE